MMRHLLKCAAAAAVLACSVPAQSLDLQRAFASAMVNDAQFQAAIKEKMAGEIYRELGLASLLPQLSLSYTDNKNQLDRTSIDSAGKPITDQSNYRSSSNVLSLRQSIVNFEGMARYRQGKAQANQSLAVFDSQTNALAIRLIDAYLSVLFSMDQIELMEAELAAYEELMKANQALWQKGEGTRTDAIETRSRFLVSQAQLMELRGGLDAAFRQLEGLVGAELRSEFEAMRGLRQHFRTAPLTPETVEAWQEQALSEDPEIRSLRYALEAARQDVERARAGHMPRVDFIASTSRSLSETTNTINQRLANQSAGVQVSVPLYSGGSVDAATRQSAANFEKARAQLDAKINEVMVDLRKHFNLVQSGSAKIAAMNEAVDSAENQVLAMRKSISGGQRVNADLLNAIQQLRTVKRDRAQARYAYMTSWLRLKAHSTTVSDVDMGKIAQFFKPD